MVLSSTGDMEQIHRTKINGSMLPKFINKNISLMGKILKVSPNGRSFDVQTGDRCVVSINLKQPLDDMMTGVVEVQGVVQDRNTVLCDYFINFPPEMSETFDLDLDNEAAVLINNVPNPWR